MTTRPKPGYLYRFHRHRPEPSEPIASASPHVSPRALYPQKMSNGQPFPSAHYYPPTWQSHPMLPPGTLDPDASPPSNSTSNRSPAPGTNTISPVPRIEVQEPTPQSGMTIDSKSFRMLEPHELTYAQQHGQRFEGDRWQWPGWMCCARRKAERLVEA
jgi:hypothetical protein